MNVVFGVQQILLGHPLYQPPNLPPYSITQYTPLYYYLAALPAAVAHVRASDVLTVSAICRFVSATIAAALAWISYLFIARRIGTTKQVAFIATGFIMSGTANWYFAVRPDGLATFLTLASFYIVTAPTLTRRRVIIAGALAVAALLAKQTAVFADIALCTWLITQRQWQKLWYMIGTSLVAGLLALSVLSLTGDAIRANVVDGVNNGIAWRPALMLAYRPVFYWFAPLIAVAFAALPQLMRRPESPTTRLIGVALIISFFMSALTALKRGSAENYFNEFVILCVFGFVACYASNRVTAEPRHIDRQLVAALQLYVATFLMIRTGHQVYTTYLYHRISPETRLTSQLPPAIYVQNHIKPQHTVLGLAVGLSNTFPERMIVPEQELATAAYSRHLVDYSRFRDDVASGQVQFAIAPNNQHLGRFLNVPLTRFRPIRQFRYYTVYELDTAVNRYGK